MIKLEEDVENEREGEVMIKLEEGVQKERNRETPLGTCSEERWMRRCKCDEERNNLVEKVCQLTRWVEYYKVSSGKI